jgi:nucleoid-associated protein YgaU
MRTEHMYAATPCWTFRAERPAHPVARRLRTASLAVAVTLAILFGLAKTAEGQEPGGFVQYQVRPGDTLWAIAAGRYPDSDVRVRVGEIEKANGLQSPVITPGEQLKLPAS